VAEILAYYEESACFNSNDREFIIGRGFQEWLLAVVGDRTADIAAVTSRKNIFAQPGRNGTDLVILIANLIGSVTDG